MSLSLEVKKNIVASFGAAANDTGSVYVQVALLTERIRELTEHLKIHAKDFSTKRGLLKLISQRRCFLKYIERTDSQGYRNLVKSLGLKK